HLRGRRALVAPARLAAHPGRRGRAQYGAARRAVRGARRRAGRGRDRPSRRGPDPRGRGRRRPPRSGAAGGRSMNATVRTVELHLTVPFAISRATLTTKKVVLVEAREGERVSRGEGVPDAFFGEDADAVARAVRDSVALIPDDPQDLATLKARLDERFPHGGAACCAIDVLAHDRAAQAAGVPLRAFLGLAPAEPPPTSFTIGLAEPEVMAERAAAAAARGFAILKVKLGHGDDVAILSAIRERFAGTIRVDANAGWSAEGAAARPRRASRSPRRRIWRRRSSGLISTAICWSATIPFARSPWSVADSFSPTGPDWVRSRHERAARERRGVRDRARHLRPRRARF